MTLKTSKCDKMTLSGSGDGLWTYLAVSAYGSDQALPLTDDTVAPATENV